MPLETRADDERSEPPSAKEVEVRRELEERGEYASPRMRLPGWGAVSLLMAAPGAVLPWLLPALIRRGTDWSTLRPALLVVPVAALVGLVAGVVGLRRAEGSASALVGLALNTVLLLLVAAVVVILVF